ncbi:hypothetical protein [Streptomyces sp. NPDC088258]|uniref:hypothetical protein n=1 Tax=Streptomyces sp. NPDC088258 TaxID=3365849 RepID=UPI00381F5DD9
MAVAEKPPCVAPQRNCGTTHGWRLGGRCAACRRAHNQDTRRRRTIAPEQREEVLVQLRAGATREKAASVVGRTKASLSQLALTDSELRAALDGLPVERQTAARRGDWLSALILAGGNVQQACRDAGFTWGMVKAWRRDDPLYAAADAAVLAWVEQSSGSRARRRVTGEILDKAAALLEQGASLTEAARATGVTSHTLRNRGKQHARLKAALPPVQSRPRKPDVQRQKLLRELWPDLSLTTVEIAERLGVELPTMYRWREELGLPYRIARKPSVKR